MDLKISVVKIAGHCPLYQEGDSFTLQEGYKLIAGQPLCMHALASLMPFYNALRVADPARLGLAGKDNPQKAFIQCPDACAFTAGGSVVFAIERS